ncbi:MAG: hypothetical protein QCH96_03385, partial [Candidatus Thermoplasmatota archaeon]|nr:hypothetical protein [Candidatus Thermoplasmatota archaeon]
MKRLTKKYKTLKIIDESCIIMATMNKKYQIRSIRKIIFKRLPLFVCLLFFTMMIGCCVSASADDQSIATQYAPV